MIEIFSVLIKLLILITFINLEKWYIIYNLYLHIISIFVDTNMNLIQMKTNLLNGLYVIKFVYTAFICFNVFILLFVCFDLLNMITNWTKDII